MRISKIHWAYLVAIAACVLASPLNAQTDWPNYGHDPGGMRFSPLDQISTKNVAQLHRVWTYDTEIKGATSASGATGGRRQFSETTPLVVKGVMYMSTAFGHVVALEPETGKVIWDYKAPAVPAYRGITFREGDSQSPPQIFVPTANGLLIALNANTGKLVPGFATEGVLNLRPGVADKFPDSTYGVSSPPAIYRDVIITGSHTQEAPAHGPSGDIRGWNAHTGKLLWTFHTIPQPGEPNHEGWVGDEWKDRSGANSWGLMTIDVARGIVYVPLGTPTTDFWGGDRKGPNLYGSSLVALDAVTGKMKWFYQTTHHDNWDYDLQAPPALIEVNRSGRKIPAVAQMTKQDLLFILDRTTGKPIFGVEEREVTSDNPNPGDVGWPTQPFPVKPAPLGRTTFKPEEISTVTPEHQSFCKELLSKEGGAMTGGPYAQYGPKVRVIFPSVIGGGDWGGVSFNPKLGYIFVNVQNLAVIAKLVDPDGSKLSRVGPEGAMGFYFWEPKQSWPCQQPPWGELSAVNANTGEIAWNVPLGEFDELTAKGIPPTGAPNEGGSITTAGGLVFIGATIDEKFRAFDAKTGKQLWVTKLEGAANAVPITYMGKDGKQYVAIMASGDSFLRSPTIPGRLIVFALP
jgi:glucose dehydrogenase